MIVLTLDCDGTGMDCFLGFTSSCSHPASPAHLIDSDISVLVERRLPDNVERIVAWPLAGLVVVGSQSAQHAIPVPNLRKTGQNLHSAVFSNPILCHSPKVVSFSFHYLIFCHSGDLGFQPIEIDTHLGIPSGFLMRHCAASRSSSQTTHPQAFPQFLMYRHSKTFAWERLSKG
jgi:hypothetical protein